MNQTPIERAHSIVSTLALTESLQRDADAARALGNTFAANMAQNAVNAEPQFLGESSSVARLRAAVILLAGITDEALMVTVDQDFDRLSETLKKIEEGEL